MNKKQKLKELHEKLKQWKEDKGVDDEDLDGILVELSGLFEPASDDPESNPPSGPGTPP